MGPKFNVAWLKVGHRCHAKMRNFKKSKSRVARVCNIEIGGQGGWLLGHSLHIGTLISAYGPQPGSLGMSHGDRYNLRVLARRRRDDLQTTLHVIPCRRRCAQRRALASDVPALACGVHLE